MNGLRTSKPEWGVRAVLLAAAACAVLALDLAFLDRIPWTATVDDGYYSAAAYRFIHTGRPGLPMHNGMLGLERDALPCGRIAAGLVGLSQAIFGVSSFASRLPALATVALSAGLVFFLARRCELSVTVSTAAAFLWSISIPARHLAHSARPEVFLLPFALSAALILHRAIQNNAGPLFFLTGILGGLSLEVHLVGSSLVVALAAGAFLLSAPSTRIRSAVLVCAGAAPGALLWLYLHGISQPDLWRIQWAGLWQKWAPAPILGGPAAILSTVARRYGDYYWKARYHRYLFEVPFVCFAVIYGFRRGGLTRLLALLFLLFHLSLALFASGPHAGYMGAVYPFACVLMAAAFFGSGRRILALAGLALVAFYLLQGGYWAAHPATPLPARLRDDVLREAGNQRFLAADNLWFYFSGDEGLRSLVTVDLAPFYAPGLPWQDALEKYLRQENVRFVVLDAVGRSLLDARQTAFFAARTTLVQRYDYGPAGSVEVYGLKFSGE